MRAKIVKYFNEMSPLFTCVATLNSCINVIGVKTLLTKMSTSLGLHKEDSRYMSTQINSFNNTFSSLLDIYTRKYGEMPNTFTSVSDATSGASYSGGG